MIDLDATSKVTFRYGQIKRQEWLNILDTWYALQRVAVAAEIGLTIPCDGKTRPCGVCDLREALQSLNRGEEQ